MGFDFDVIVIGGGAGGGAFAHECAVAGKKTLLLERGSRATIDRSARDEHATLIEKRPYDDRSIAVNEVPSRLYMGGVLGGGTALYGGALMRPSSEDFHPGKHYSTRLPRELWDWPVDYERLAPYFDEAETLYRVATEFDEDFGPLEPTRVGRLHDLLPLAPINQRLIEANRARGLRPFRLPLAIEARLCDRCANCAGFLCPNGARRSAAHIVDEAAKQHGLNVMTNIEVVQIEKGASREIQGIVVRNRVTSAESRLRARCYALAAGAIGSPAILLKSGFDSPHLGRNYIMHYNPIAIGVFAASTGADHTFIKQVGFTDFYFGTPAMPEKMGLVQSLPAPGPVMLAKSGMRRWPQTMLRFLRGRMLPLAGIVEDLPNPTNRVTVEADGSIALKHRFSSFDRERGRALGREMRRILRSAGAIVRLSRAIPSREHVAHQCGTLRCGTDPKHAVVDADCRLFGYSNLFVVDGSVLPTSLGVGPTLTIVANALRVGRAAATEI